MMKYIGYFLLILIFILVCVLATLNAQWISFNYIVGVIQMPLIVLALISFILGLLIGMLLMLFRRNHRNKRIKKAKA